MPGGGRDSSTGALFAHGIPFAGGLGGVRHGRRPLRARGPVPCARPRFRRFPAPSSRTGPRWRATPSPRSGGDALPRTDSPIKKTAFSFSPPSSRTDPPDHLRLELPRGVLSRLVHGLNPAGPLAPGAAPGEGRPRAPPCLGFRRAVWGSAAAPPPHTASPMPRASSTRPRPSRKIGTPRWCCACALRAPVPSVPPRPPRRHAHRVPAGHLSPPPRAAPPPPPGTKSAPTPCGGGALGFCVARAASAWDDAATSPGSAPSRARGRPRSCPSPRWRR